MFYRNKNKTVEYREYQNEIRDELMGVPWPYGDRMVTFSINAGLSNRAADLDNVVKPVLDTFQSIYDEFNDNKVYEIHLYKRIVGRGDEYLEVDISEVELEEPKEKSQAES